MKKQPPWNRLIAWYEERPLRERGMLLVCLLVVTFFLADTLLLTPLTKRTRQLQTETEQVQLELAELKTKEQLILLRKDFDPDRENRERLAALNAELKRLRTQLQDDVIKLVSPREMAALLKELLRRQKKLQLIALENLAAEELKISGQVAEKNPVAGLYRHRLRIEFSGDYLSMLKYLHELEGMPRNLLWDRLEIETLEYPRARIRFDVSTLSMEQGWIGG